MAIPSNIKPKDRLAALRFANQALDALDAIHSKWILREATRPAATALRTVKTRLQLLVTMLGDATADHYAVAHDLGVVIAQLMAVDDLRLVKPMMNIEQAREKILGGLTA